MVGPQQHLVGEARPQDPGPVRGAARSASGIIQVTAPAMKLSTKFACEESEEERPARIMRRRVSSDREMPSGEC